MAQQQYSQPVSGATQSPQYSQQGQSLQQGTQQQQSRQPIGYTLENALPGEMRLVLHDLVQSAIACEWCADQCLDSGPEMAECVRLCRDVADLALQNVRFVSRDSVFGPEEAETFAYAAQECAQECARHPHEHCQECADVLQRAVNSTWQLLDAIGGQTEQTQQSQMGQIQQPQTGQTQ